MAIRLSLTMIVKDEAATLGRCLSSVRDILDEIVVVDTGSTDCSKEIARQYGVRVFDLPWPVRVTRSIRTWATAVGIVPIPPPNCGTGCDANAWEIDPMTNQPLPDPQTEQRHDQQTELKRFTNFYIYKIKIDKSGIRPFIPSP
jgi:glycosyltransferase involved in cell wall biosynthesis